MRLRNAIDNTARSGQLARRERKPGDEADLVGGAISQHILAVAVDEVVAILHCHHWKYATGSLDFCHRDLAQSRMEDDTLVQKLTHCAELFVARHAWVDAMKLPEIDPFNAEPFETALRLGDQIGGTSVGCPLVWALAS